MKKYYTLADASQITGIPVTTIRYWLRTGYVSFKKDSDNGYHIITDDDIWILIDRAQSRNSGIDLNYSHDLLDYNDWITIYESTLNKLQTQKNNIEYQMDLIRHQINSLHELTYLKNVPFVNTIPNFKKLVKLDFNNNKLKERYLTTINFTTYVEIADDLSLNKIDAISVPQDFKNGEILWTYNENDVYYATLITRSMTDGTENTLSVFKSLIDAGHIPEYMIVDSIINDTKSKINYFKAYIKVKEIK